MIVDSFYLCYLLKSPQIFKYISTNCVSGSALPRIVLKAFKEVELDIPDMECQIKIVKILKDIEDKIQINNRINNNLVAQVFALYENTILSSTDAKETVLSSLCDFQEGYVNPSQTHQEYFDGDVKWLRAVDINESFITETSRTLTRAGFESAKKSALLFNPNTIAISKSGTIGRLGIIADYMCGNRAVINIAPHEPNMLAFIYCFLKSKQREFPNMAVGSVQKNLYVSLLEPLAVIVPDDKSLATFNAVGTSLFNAIHNNCVENTKLACLRDSILPKLMSGELDVSNIDL
jgi:type I restriction enzyme S subunit